MALRKQSKAGLWVGLIVILVLFGTLAFLTVKFLDSAGAVADESLVAENAALREQLSAQNTAARWEATKSIIVWVAGFVFLAFVAWLYFRSKQGEKYALTIAEAKKRVKKLVTSGEIEDTIHLGEPCWVDCFAGELKTGRPYYYLLVGFRPKVWGRVQNPHTFKIIGVDPLDWDRGRDETIPMGLTLDEFFRTMFHRRNTVGAMVVRGIDEDAEEFAVHLAQKRKKSDEVLEAFGGTV